MIVNNALFYIIISLGVVMYWRGTWVLMDMYIYPEDMKKSGWISAEIGYGGFAMAAAIQGLSRDRKYSILEGKNYKSKLLLGFYNYIVAFLGVNCWRGIWLLQEVYLLENDKKSSAWISHGLGTVLLFILLHFQSTFAAPLLILSEYDNDYQPNNLIRSPSLFVSKSDVTHNHHQDVEMAQSKGVS
jgi:hypothetical protein